MPFLVSVIWDTCYSVLFINLAVLVLYMIIQGDVLEVYLDDGRLIAPPSFSIPLLPSSTVEPVHRALSRILNPGIEFRDHLFGMGTNSLKVKSMELQVF